MRASHAYLVSALLHLGVLAGLWHLRWAPATAPASDLRRGVSLTITWSAPAEAAESTEPTVAEFDGAAPKFLEEHSSEASPPPPPTSDVASIARSQEAPASPAPRPVAVAFEPLVPETRPARQASPRPAPGSLPSEIVPRRAVSPPRTRRTVRASPTPVAADSPPSAGGIAGAVADDLPVRRETNAPPSYPPEALRDGIQGRVVLRVAVLKSGTVGAAVVAKTSGDERLDRAALEAVRRWTFTPARRAGAPIDFELLVPVNFRIRGGASG